MLLNGFWSGYHAGAWESDGGRCQLFSGSHAPAWEPDGYYLLSLEIERRIQGLVNLDQIDFFNHGLEFIRV